ncbi:MAG: helix-turn-helix transcriptional regulator [Chloroflexi bacterium]|nr:helix-turn-helix transcriptional regulator [Chloroflexota bacterium]MBI3168578.1 helix-turn-helix transcriptional regulator [Chloroflexota bacterium]
MEPEKDDRRTRRTRQLLRDAFLALLKEKRYESISVQDIIEKADVGRSTFYAHYDGKEDLLVGRNGIFASNLAHQAAHEVRIATGSSMLAWFQHIQGQGAILKVIVRDPAMDLAMKTLYGLIQHDMERRIQMKMLRVEDPTLPLDLAAEFLTSTLMTLIRWWVKQDMTLSPKQMDEMFQKLTAAGIS